ncbi:MAG: glycosyltransferase family 2 protein [Planctomycetota bacterium]
MNDEEHNAVTFSFVSPVYNEAKGLEEFYTRLKAAADELGESYEIIFVNDGSQDGTDEILRRLAKSDKHVKVVEFSRNFGHQVAVTGGYDYARGKAVVSLDSDCQHPPEMIGQLIERWREGFEVVYTIRRDTSGLSRIRRVIGRGVYRVIAAISGAELTDQADFRLLDRKALDALKSHREHARFVRGLVKWIGFRQIAIPYVAGKRTAGRSNYTLRQLGGMAGAGVFNFSLRPLRFAGLLGGTLILIALLYALVALVLLPFGIHLSAMMHLLMFVVGMFGLNFLLLGIIGEYVGRIFDEAKGRPLYIVRETISFAPQDEKGKTYVSDEKSADQAQRFSVFT